jgi:hypothetical protein
LKSRGVFGPVQDAPPQVSSIDFTWFFKTKRDADGRISRHKARLVARGFTQRQGDDFDATYAPVFYVTAMRWLVHLAMATKATTATMDVVTAYLYGDVDEEIYLVAPPSFIPEHKKGKF